MPRTLRILAWVVGALAALPILLLGLVGVLAGTPWGRHAIEQATARFSGGQVVVSGLAGRFPDDLRLAHAEVHDGQGQWVSADDITLQWFPSQLLRRGLHVDLLRAGRVQVLRLPLSSPSPKSATRSYGDPMRIDIDRVEINRLDIGAPIAGAAASLTIQGRADIRWPQAAEVALRAARTDAPGTYTLSGRIDSTALNAQILVDEPAHGLLSGLAQLPDLGAVSAQLSFQGPRNAEVTRLTVAAGPLRASGRGLVDLVGRSLELDVTASAPAMAPSQDLRWKAIALQAHVRGPFTRPDTTAQVRIDDLNAGGAKLRTVRADVQGNRGTVSVHAVLEGLRIPGPKPDLLQSAPVDLRADVRLDDPARPVAFILAHPLVSVQGHADTGGPISAAFTVVAPALAPFAAIARIDLQGQATLTAHVTNRGQATNVDVDGTVGVTGGMEGVPELIGGAAKIGVSAVLQDQDVTLNQVRVDGKTLQVSANGTSKGGTVDLNWKAAFSNLAVLAPNVSGRIDVQGRVTGAQGDLSLTLDANGDVAAEGFRQSPIKASVRLQGLPGAPSGDIEARGTLDGSPLQLAMSVVRSPDGALRGTVRHADWRSVHVQADASLRGGFRLPQGRMIMHIARLEDLAPWIGQGAQGSIDANVDLVQAAGRAQAKIEVDAHQVAVPGIEVDHVRLTGTVEEPTAHPTVALALVADGLAASGLAGSARLSARGPPEAIKFDLTSDLHQAGGADAQVSSTGTLDATGRQVSVSKLQATYQGRLLHLLSPVHVSFRDGVVVDRLRAGMEQAVLEADGRIWPTLDLAASLRNGTYAVIKAFLPELPVDGSLSMDARLSGPITQPRGTVHLSADGLRMRTGPGQGLQPGHLVATADLGGQSVHVDFTLSAGGQTRLEASGQVPLSAAGPIDLHASATIDAAVANRILAVDGRRVNGQVAVEAAVGGTLSAPQLTGSFRLSAGAFHDDTIGAHLTQVEALIRADGDTLRFESLTAHAGPGTVSASGTVGLFVPGRPVDLKVTARNAQPLASDFLTANMDLDLTLRGQSQTRLDIAGRIKINRADINIPNALPPEVGVLDVRRPGQATAPSSSARTAVTGLDLTVDAPGAVFVRGRGLDAEMSGALRVRGTTASPQISDGFDLRRGTLDLGGASLKFTSGRISFEGTGPTRKIRPTLAFEAESTSGNITAKLDVSGYADAPKVTLTSTPELPQDEILARLLFGASVKQLTALQAVQIGSALASIGGLGGGSIVPLTSIQKTLGLDRLSVGGTSTGETTVEAGRYVSKGVYVGAKETGTSGTTQAQVQVDLTKHLKAQASLGAGGTVQGATPDNDAGSSVGLSYQFEY